MGMILYTKEGTPVEIDHPVDVKDALATGAFFKVNPLIQTQPPPAEPDKELEKVDLSDAPDIAATGEETDVITPAATTKPDLVKEDDKKSKKNK